MLWVLLYHFQRKSRVQVSMSFLKKRCIKILCIVLIVFILQRNFKTFSLNDSHLEYARIIQRIVDNKSKQTNTGAKPDMFSYQTLSLYPAAEKLSRQIIFENFSAHTHNCAGLLRPKTTDIFWRNKKWQYAVFGFKYVYALNAYLDNRLNPHLIRIFLAVSVPESTVELISEGQIVLLLWYENVVSPISALARRDTVIWVKFWRIRGRQLAFIPYYVALSDNQIPKYVSLADRLCPVGLLTTYFKVILPKPLNKTNTRIGACIKPLFGNFTFRNASYLVSWMESLRYFGVQRAHIIYDALSTDSCIEKIFQYYVNLGYITFEHIPHQLYETEVPVNMTDAMSQSVVGPIVNDCFYRRLNDYRYTLHIDYDEILVPRYNASYLDVISRYMASHPRDVRACSVCSRSAFFYTNTAPGSPEEPEWLPIFRYTMRQPTEIPGVTHPTGTGVRKCFQSNLYSRYMYIHNSAGLTEGAVTAGPLVFLNPDDDILIHHYRSKCKLKARCRTEGKRAFKDETFAKVFRFDLLKRVKAVLSSVGYFNISDR